MPSIDTPPQSNPDDKPPWHELSTQQLKRAGLNISDIEQRKIDKSLTRLRLALQTAGFDWTEVSSDANDTETDSRGIENFDSYLTTYR